MSLWCRTSAVWREIYNPSIRTSAVWRTPKNMEVRTSGVWRNSRPSTKSNLTIGSYTPGKGIYYYGLSDGSILGVSFGSLAAPTYFGSAQITNAYWIGTALTFQLATASLGSAFIGYVAVSSSTCSSFTYSTGTGYSRWTGSLSSTPPASGTVTLHVRGP